MLEAARVLSQHDFESTIRFVGFNAEEDGLSGSRDFVNKVVVPRGENIVGMVNMDAILGRSSDDPSLEIIAGRDEWCPGCCPRCEEWTDVFVTAANTYAPALPIGPVWEGAFFSGSDHLPFKYAGYPAFQVVAPGTPYGWHGPEDASDGPAGEYFDYAFAADVVSAVVATIAQEAEVVTVPEPAARALMIWLFITFVTFADLRRLQGREVHRP